MPDSTKLGSTEVVKGSDGIWRPVESVGSLLEAISGESLHLQTATKLFGRTDAPSSFRGFTKYREKVETEPPSASEVGTSSNSASVKWSPGTLGSLLPESIFQTTFKITDEVAKAMAYDDVLASVACLLRRLSFSDLFGAVPVLGKSNYLDLRGGADLVQHGDRYLAFDIGEGSGLVECVVGIGDTPGGAAAMREHNRECKDRFSKDYLLRQFNLKGVTTRLGVTAAPGELEEIDV